MKMSKAQKQYQVKVNADILRAIDNFNSYMKNNESGYSFHRLRYCNATVQRYNDYIVLVSYDTIVAFIDRSTMTFYDVLRYVYGFTSTSAQHIAKFRSDFRDYIREELRYYPC